MKKTLPLISIAVMALAMLVVGVFFTPSRQPDPARIVVADAQAPVPVGESSLLGEAPTPEPTVPQSQPAAEMGKLSSSQGVVTQVAAPLASPAVIGPVTDAPLDPLARAALSSVGADPDAEEYWLAAINDPSLPATERQDLIEDLNEDGLSDPRHPTADDLPLILGRLRLIEDVGEEAMDEVNADAFQEAYKDLLHLAHLASGGQFP